MPPTAATVVVAILLLACLPATVAAGGDSGSSSYRHRRLSYTKSNIHEALKEITLSYSAYYYRPPRFVSPRPPHRPLPVASIHSAFFFVCVSLYTPFPSSSNDTVTRHGKSGISDVAAVALVRLKAKVWQARRAA